MQVCVWDRVITFTLLAVPRGSCCLLPTVEQSDGHCCLIQTSSAKAFVIWQEFNDPNIKFVVAFLVPPDAACSTQALRFVTLSFTLLTPGVVARWCIIILLLLLLLLPTIILYYYFDINGVGQTVFVPHLQHCWPTCKCQNNYVFVSPS